METGESRREDEAVNEYGEPTSRNTPSSGRSGERKQAVSSVEEEKEAAVREGRNERGEGEAGRFSSSVVLERKPYDDERAGELCSSDIPAWWNGCRGKLKVGIADTT